MRRLMVLEFGRRDRELVDVDPRRIGRPVNFVEAAVPAFRTVGDPYPKATDELELRYTTYVVRLVAAGPAMMLRAGVRDWPVLVPASYNERDLEVLLARDAKPVVDGPCDALATILDRQVAWDLEHAAEAYEHRRRDTVRRNLVRQSPAARRPLP